jgi:NIPSNAP
MPAPFRSAAVTLAVFAIGFAAGQVFDSGQTARAQSSGSGKVFELRTYTAPEGKLPNLLARFRDHTMRIFDRHGMTSVAYFVPQDEPAASNTLIYIISHDSREAAERNWAAFRDDPEWQRVAEESQVDGRIVEKVESVFMSATDFSPLR